MLCFLEDVTKWVDKGSPVDIIYLYFKLYYADRRKPHNPSYEQTVENLPINSQLVSLSFTAITSSFKGKNKAMVWCYAPKQVYTN